MSESPVTHSPPPLVFNLFFSSKIRFKLPYVGLLFLRSEGIVASFSSLFSLFWPVHSGLGGPLGV